MRPEPWVIVHSRLPRWSRRRKKKFTSDYLALLTGLAIHFKEKELGRPCTTQEKKELKKYGRACKRVGFTFGISRIVISHDF